MQLVVYCSVLIARLQDEYALVKNIAECLPLLRNINQMGDISDQLIKISFATKNDGLF
jgi:hypothetical protein